MSDNTDNHTSIDNGKATSPSDDLMARAAEILGLEDSGENLGSTGSQLVLVTINGPDNRHQIMKVPTDVPVGALASSMGDAVGVTVMSHVALRGGEVILPDQTLAELGVRTGSQLFVVPPQRRGDSPSMAGSGSKGSQQPWARTALPRRPAMGETRTRGQWALLGVSALAIVVVAMLVGGAVFGASAPPASTTPTAAQRLSTAAAVAWVDGTRFVGRRMATVPADLGRSGPATNGTVEAAGSSTSGGITSQMFIVAPPAGRVYGLSVVVFKGQIAYPPTVTPLPFATSVPPGRAPFVPQSGKIVPPTANKQAQGWADTVFGTVAQPSDALGYGVNGRVKVLDEWKPKTGAALVTRVSVPLAGTAPGTPAASGLSAARAAVAYDNDAVTTAQSALSTQKAAVQQDTAELAKATTTAQAAVAASNTANPPNPPPLQAAATAAQQAAAAAQAALTAAQHAQAAAEAALSTATQTQTTDTAALTTMTASVSMFAVSVYDVAYNTAGNPIAWAPADYLVGQS